MKLKPRIMAIFAALAVATLLGGCISKDAGIAQTQPTKTPSATSADPVERYRAYLNTLDVAQIVSSGQAMAKLRELAGKDTKKNDEMFRVYNELYLSVITNQTETETEPDAAVKKVLEENGYVSVDSGEGTWTVAEKPGYMMQSFQGIVSTEVAEYLAIVNKETAEAPVAVDGILSVPFAELENRIITCETFVGKYKDAPEASVIKTYLENYVTQYLTARDFAIDVLYTDNVLTDEARQSYEHFVSTYPKSSFNGLVKGYLEVLKAHNYELTDEVRQYLDDNQIDTSWFDMQAQQNGEDEPLPTGDVAEEEEQPLEEDGGQ